MFTLVIVAGIFLFSSLIVLRRKKYQRAGKRDPLSPLFYWGIGLFSGAGLLAILFHSHIH